MCAVSVRAGRGEAGGRAGVRDCVIACGLFGCAVMRVCGSRVRRCDWL